MSECRIRVRNPSKLPRNIIRKVFRVRALYNENIKININDNRYQCSSFINLTYKIENYICLLLKKNFAFDDYKHTKLDWNTVFTINALVIQ